MLFNRFAPDITVHTGQDRQLHFMLVGGDNLGRSILLQMARTGHFAGCRQLLVSIVDRRADAVKQQLKADYPWLAEMVELQFHKFDLATASQSAIAGISQKIPVITSFICLEDSGLAAEVGLRLINCNPPAAAKIVLCLTAPITSPKISQQLNDAGISCFTTSDCNLPENAEDPLDRCARALYLETARQQTDGKNVSEWHELNNERKNSYRVLADHFEIMLRALNQMRWHAGKKRFAAGDEISDTELAILAEMDHRRPVTEQLTGDTNSQTRAWESLNRQDQIGYMDNLKKRLYQQMRIRCHLSGKRETQTFDISSDTLKQAIVSQNIRGQEYTKPPLIGLRINSAELADIPEILRINLGSVDKKDYTRTDFSRYLNGAVLMQLTEKEQPDFYPVEAEVLAENYQCMPCDFTDPTINKLQQQFPEAIRAIFDDRDLTFIKLEKKKTEIFELSTLGWPVTDEVRLKNADGGIQIKPAGREGFVACNRKGCYLINADERGFPCGYSLVGL